MSRTARSLDRLATLAGDVAAAWEAAGRGQATSGSERALLRLCGVEGLDRAGKPLAWSVVERFAGRDPERLGGGITLPFAIALLEYDVDPQQLALDVAAGVVDLAFEAGLLAEADRRAAAEAEATRLLAAAAERIDANRTARAELRSVLGDPDPPRLGVLLDAGTAAEAGRRGAAAVRAGADAVLVETPSGRELIERLSVAGLEVVRWQPPDPDRSAPRIGAGPGAAAGTSETEPPAPPGSQRGLAALRRTLDEVAAERGAYVRIATSAPAFGAPEQAVVAALERVDLVVADPFREIVDDGVDPGRAIADHVFAERLVRRSGAGLVVGPGPLVIGPDLAAGRPSGTSGRLGRAVALLAVSVDLARRAGLGAADIIVDAVPPWLFEEPGAAQLVLALVAVERALFPGHPFALRRMGAGPELDSPAGWAVLVAGLLPLARPVDLVAGPDADPEAVGRAALGLRAAAAVAEGLPTIEAAMLRGSGADVVAPLLEAGAAYLAELRDRGPAAIHEGRPRVGGRPGDGPPLGAMEIGGKSGRPAGFGGEAVVERGGGFDPLVVLEG